MSYIITNDTKYQYKDSEVCQDCSFGTPADYEAIITAHQLGFVFQDAGYRIMRQGMWYPMPYRYAPAPLSAIQREVLYVLCFYDIQSTATGVDSDTVNHILANSYTRQDIQDAIHWMAVNGAIHWCASCQQYNVAEVVRQANIFLNHVREDGRDNLT